MGFLLLVPRMWAFATWASFSTQMISMLWVADIIGLFISIEYVCGRVLDLDYLVFYDVLQPFSS